jgi:transitional endoplasmic reticulum ATPase
MLPGGLWEALAGMEHEKQLIERRIVLPLVDPDLAANRELCEPVPSGR